MIKCKLVVDYSVENREHVRVCAGFLYFDVLDLQQSMHQSLAGLVCHGSDNQRHMEDIQYQFAYSLCFPMV